MVSLVSVVVYSGLFYSRLTVPQEIFPLETVEQLTEAALDNKAILFTSRFMYDMAVKSLNSRSMNGSNTASSFDTAMATSMAKHWNILKAWVEGDFHARASLFSSYDWQRELPIYLITSKTLLQFYAVHAPFKLFVGQPTFMTDTISMATQRHALFTHAFSKTIQRMVECGLLQKWTLDMLQSHFTKAKKPFVYHEHRDLVAFGMKQYQAIFTLFMAGNCLIVIIFLGEVLMVYFNKNKHD